MGALGAINSTTNVYTKAEADLSAPLVIVGAEVDWVSASTLTIGNGDTSYIKDSTNVLMMSFTGTLGLDITVSGAGGLDTGAEASSTWYAVYIIGDTAGVNTPKGILSASFVAPTLPSGYDVFRRIFSVRNNSSSDLRKYYSQSRGAVRRVFWDETFTSLRPLNGGGSTIYAPVSLVNYMPPTANTVDIACTFSNIGGTAGDYFLLRPTGSTVATTVYFGSIGILLTNSVGLTVSIEVPTDTSQSIDYLVSNAADTLTIYVQGYIAIL